MRSKKNYYDQNWNFFDSNIVLFANFGIGNSREKKILSQKYMLICTVCESAFITIFISALIMKIAFSVFEKSIEVANA